MSSILLSWSGGKDSSLTLFQLLNEKKYHIATLITNVTEGYDRITMHGVRAELLDLQATALNLPLHKIYTSQQSSNEEYEEKMSETFSLFRNNDINTAAYGDIFLEDLRDYREKLLARSGFSGIYPLWKQSTQKLSRMFIELGFKAILTCVNGEVLDYSFAGRMFDNELLSDLPDNVDPCGENGEFHTFVFDGPVFQQPVPIKTGEKVTRGIFHYCDVVAI